MSVKQFYCFPMAYMLFINKRRWCRWINRQKLCQKS